jgi:hypothetical protein
LLRYISPQNDAEQEQAVAKEYLKQYFEGVKYGKWFFGDPSIVVLIDLELFG